MAKKGKKNQTPGMRDSSGWMYAAAVFVCAVGAFAGYKGYSGLALLGADQPATCTVESTTVNVVSETDGTDSRYFPAITISHEVGGKKYVREDEGPRESTRSDAQRVLDRYPEGSEHPCKYVASSPDIVVIMEPSTTVPIVWLLFGLAMFGLAIGLVVSALRRSRG